MIDEPEFWDMLDEEYERVKRIMWIDTFAFFNQYFDFYAFINIYSNMQPLFRLWPDRERLENIFGAWNFNIRRYSNDGHNPFFDAVQYQACIRLGACDPAELTVIEEDSHQSLLEMNEAPNWQRQVTCTTLPVDPFSVWAHDFIEANPWIRELFGFNIEVQTLDAHEIWDRCWCSVMWERSPYHLECASIGDNPAHTTHGADYLIAYWLGVYYGILPGDGPYGDDELIDDDTVLDDDTVDDDTVDDDTVDDDTVDDDALDDDLVDDDPTDDVSGGGIDDDAVDDDIADDVPAPLDSDDDDDGCGC